MRVFYEFFLIICALLISIYFLVFTNLIDSFDLKLPSLQKIQAGAFQIFLVLATATSAAFFQWQFNKNDRNNTKIAEATRFNEAVVYLKTLIEDTRTNYADNVLQEYITEKQHVEDLNSKPLGNEYNISLTSIPELRAAQTSAFLDKIPNLGKYYQIIDAYYYAQGQIQNFNDVAIERTLSIKEQRNNSFKKIPVGLIKTYASETFQKTTLLLGYSDGILESLIFIAQELDKVSKELKKELKHIDSKIKIISLGPETEEQKELRENLQNIAENETPFKGKIRYLKKPDQT